MLVGELKKLSKDVPVFVTHSKPGHVLLIEQELEKMNLARVELIEQGKTYNF